MEYNDTEKIFEEVISDYGVLISKICYYFASDREEFNDLRQEVFCNIWKGIGKFRHDSKLSTWIYRVSFNTCISYQRKEKKIEKIPIDNIVDIPEDDLGVTKMEKYKTMHTLIRRLKYDERAIILMWLDEMSYEEISALTGLNRNTVAIRIKRIKEKLVNMVK